MRSRNLSLSTSSPYPLCVCIPSRMTTQSHLHRAWRERSCSDDLCCWRGESLGDWRLAGISTCSVSPQASHRTTRQNIDAHTAIVSARDVTIFDPLPADFISSELSLFHGSDRLTHWQSAMHKTHPSIQDHMLITAHDGVEYLHFIKNSTMWRSSIHIQSRWAAC